MKKGYACPIALAVCALLAMAGCRGTGIESVTVPFTLDHNRMLVEAEIQRDDGSWRKALLWVDTGNPTFFISGPLAADLGIESPGAEGGLPGSPEGGAFEVTAPAGVRIGGMAIDFAGVKSVVMTQPFWLFSATHNDANLPSTVLMKYHVVFDYPEKRLTIARPGAIEPRGTMAPADVHAETGIVQVDAVIDGDSLSLALDNGASYSFADAGPLERLFARHPGMPRLTGTTGCANMWGWWPPMEETLPLFRLPEVAIGPVSLTGVGIVGVTDVFQNGYSLGRIYSMKSARPVAGFLGPNSFIDFRVEIDYADGAVYFERGARPGGFDMDLVGLALRPLEDGRYEVLGVAVKDGKPLVEGVERGDLLLRVGDLSTDGATMGAVVDALRGVPGEIRTLVLEREGVRFTIEAKVERCLGMN